jgi:hypothetical protein
MYAFRSVAVDENGRCEISEALEDLAKKVKAIEDRCTDLHPDELVKLIFSAAAFEPPPLSLKKSA